MGELNGNIDELTMWNRALTQEEIVSSVSYIDVQDESLVGYWRFDDPPGNELIDSSIYGNNGNIDGATWSLDSPAYILG